VFSHGDTYHHTMITGPVATWENMEWTPAREKRTMDYLKSRWQGTQDSILFHEDPQGQPGENPGRDRGGLLKTLHRHAHERNVGRATALPRERLPQHAGLGVMQTIAYFARICS
jgi:hypothetical protein